MIFRDPRVLVRCGNAKENNRNVVMQSADLPALAR